MRTIKFRGWHTVQKKMFSAEEMATDQLTLLPTGSFINVSSTHYSFSEIYPADKFIPLQFTGLLDKNGKEIYEGDVLNYGDYTDGSGPCNHIVTWKDGGFITNEISTNEDFTFVDPCGEVIGTIYENPELLRLRRA